MPTYEMKCEECTHSFDVFQKMSDPLPTQCPACSQVSLRQVFGAGIMIVYDSPTTIGQQAEINAKRMGREQMQLLEADLKKPSEYTGPIPEGATRVPPPEGTPWYRQGLADPSKSINLSKVPDVRKYIETGVT